MDLKDHKLDPTINVEQGDALLGMEPAADFSSHPIYLRDSNGNNIPNVNNNGATHTFQTIGWDTETGATPGTYKYQCNHPNMSGDIVVHPQKCLESSNIFRDSTGNGNNVSEWCYGSLEHIGTNLCNGLLQKDLNQTFYYECGSHSAMVGQVIVNATQGCQTPGGNHADPTCQQGSPNLEIVAENPRETRDWLYFWLV